VVSNAKSYINYLLISLKQLLVHFLCELLMKWNFKFKKQVLYSFIVGAIGI